MAVRTVSFSPHDDRALVKRDRAPPHLFRVDRPPRIEKIRRQSAPDARSLGIPSVQAPAHERGAVGVARAEADAAKRLADNLRPNIFPVRLRDADVGPGGVEVGRLRGAIQRES